MLRFESFSSAAVGRDVIVSGIGRDLWVSDTAGRHRVQRPLAGHTGLVTSVAAGLAGGREIFVSGSRDATVRVWDAVTGQPLGEPLTGHTGTVTAVAIGRAADRDVVVSAGDDGTVRVWDAVTGQPLGEPFTGHTGTVTAVAIGRVGGRDVIVSAGSDATVRIWDSDGALVEVLDQLAPVCGVALTAGGSLYVGVGNAVVAYDVEGAPGKDPAV
jgi:WD40 repeat protein